MTTREIDGMEVLLRHCIELAAHLLGAAHLSRIRSSERGSRGAVSIVTTVLEIGSTPPIAAEVGLVEFYP